jgi:hypothetical protein
MARRMLISGTVPRCGAGTDPRPVPTGGSTGAGHDGRLYMRHRQVEQRGDLTVGARGGGVPGWSGPAARTTARQHSAAVAVAAGRARADGWAARPDVSRGAGAQSSCPAGPSADGCPAGPAAGDCRKSSAACGPGAWSAPATWPRQVGPASSSALRTNTRIRRGHDGPRPARGKGCEAGIGTVSPHGGRPPAAWRGRWRTGIGKEAEDGRLGRGTGPGRRHSGEQR